MVATPPMICDHTLHGQCSKRTADSECLLMQCCMVARRPACRLSSAWRWCGVRSGYRGSVCKRVSMATDKGPRGGICRSFSR